MIRGLLSASPILLGAVAVDAKKNQPAPKEEPDSLAHYKCKPSDLPLYTPLHAHNKKEPPHEAKLSAPEQALQDGISVVRVEVTGVVNAISSQKQNLSEAIDKGMEHTKFIVEYLNEPDNSAPRVGAVAIGGLAGLIFSLRGGIIRRFLYMSIGAGGIASICYPKEAEYYAQKGLVEAKKAATITYNFAFGVKPGDDVNAPEFAKIPTNASEWSDSFSDLAKSAKDALFSSKK